MNLKIGQPFPDVELPDHENQPVRLSQFAGKFPLILSFYRGYW
jgi:peroxiredoxin